MTTTTQHGRETADRSSIVGQARRFTGSPLLYVGAVTVVASHELVSWLPLSDIHVALALFPVTLAVLYAQLLLLATYEQLVDRDAPRSPR